MPGIRLIASCVAIATLWAAAAPAQPFAYVANLGSDDVTVIDAAGLLPVARLPAGDDPDGVALSPDGRRVYVASFVSGTVHTIDAETQQVIASATVGGGPVGLAATPDGERLYVTRREDDTVAVLGLASGTVEAVIPVGYGPNAIAITPDGATALVTNSFMTAPGEVSVLDLAENRERNTIDVARKPNRVAITPDGRTAYVTNFRSWTSTAIDLASETVRTTFRAGYQNTGVAVNPNGYWAYITDAYADHLLIVDVSADQVTRRLALGPYPSAVAVQRHGGTGFVTDFGEHALYRIDLGDEAVIDAVPVGERPFAVAVNCVGAGCDEEPYTPKPTRTATATPTPSDTPTPSATPSDTPTVTPTRTLPSGVSHVTFTLTFGAIDGDGSTVMGVTVDPGHQHLHGLRERILLPNGVGLKDFGELDCLIESGLATQRVEFDMVAPPECDFGCLALSVAIDFTEPLDTPSLVYSCVLDVDPFAPVGTARLRHLENTALDADGGALPSRGRDGILVIPPPVTPSPDLTPRPTRTPTQPLPPEVFIAGGRVEVAAGGRGQLPIALNAGARQVAGTQNDIDFAPGIAVAARANGRPDCTVNPAIDKNGTAFSFQPPQCLASNSCTSMRALVLSFESVAAIPDGAVLYTCALDVAAGVAPGTYPLRVWMPGASTPDGSDIPAGASDALVTVRAPAAARQRGGAVRAARVCAGGDRDGFACAADGDCPAGACVVPQGVCDGGEDDGLLCDCPGGACRSAGASCGFGGDAGACQGGELDGACCDRSFNCGGGSACVATRHLCAGGPAKGSPCLADAHCLGGRCVASGRRCAGGDFDGVACLDGPDCPAGACIDPSAVTGLPTPVPTPTRRAVETDDSCAVAPPGDGGSAGWLLIPAVTRLIPRHGGGRRSRGAC